MTYIGEEDGVKGYHFIRTSGAIFLGATATFDETIFPRCRSASTPISTDLGNLPPLDMEDHNHSDGTGDDGGDDIDYHTPPAYPSS
jgi:hypothetical protein